MHHVRPSLLHPLDPLRTVLLLVRVPPPVHLQAAPLLFPVPSPYHPLDLLHTVPLLVPVRVPPPVLLVLLQAASLVHLLALQAAPLLVRVPPLVHLFALLQLILLLLPPLHLLDLQTALLVRVPLLVHLLGQAVPLPVLIPVLVPLLVLLLLPHLLVLPPAHLAPLLDFPLVPPTRADLPVHLALRRVPPHPHLDLLLQVLLRTHPLVHPQPHRPIERSPIHFHNHGSNSLLLVIPLRSHFDPPTVQNHQFRHFRSLRQVKRDILRKEQGNL